LNKIQTLLLRIRDQRSRKVIFAAHCILNENTRYLGGACRGGCVSEIIYQCVEKNMGIVQMPCPKQHAWGGVLKRLLLTAYDSKETMLYTFRNIAIPVFLLYTKLIYARMATRTVRQIQDYHESGFHVLGIVGIDGSPTCGVNRTLDFKRSFKALADININTVTIADTNKVIRECLATESGLFIRALRTKLNRRNMNICFWGHDLAAELDGKISNVIF